MAFHFLGRPAARTTKPASNGRLFRFRWYLLETSGVDPTALPADRPDLSSRGIYMGTREIERLK